jgi:hypothetical protein
MPKDLELLIEPEFKKTPREKRKDKKKGYGYEKGDFEIPMIGALGGGMTVAAGAAYDKAQKLNKKYKKKKKDKEEDLTSTEGSFKNGGLVKKGRPKLAKKGWK